MKRSRIEQWNLEHSDNLSDCGQMLNVDLQEQTDHVNFDQSKDTLQSIVQSCICGNNKGLIPECKHVSTVQDKLTSDDLKNWSNYSLLSFNKNSNIEDDPCIKFQQEKLQPTISSDGTNMIVTVNVVSKKAEKTKKTRIRWNEDLHNKFMESIMRLGGAKKATPKEILKLMNCEGLTIFHIKSHLQKYRVARLMQESTQGSCCGSSYSSTCNALGNSEQPDSKTGIQIVEALRLQLDVQKRLYEQLESQKKLQVHIEEQAKQLQNMIKCQMKQHDR